MDKYVCKVCLEKFDHSFKRPLVLFRCAHTFCAHCVENLAENVCPICRNIIEETSPNWSILETTPESNYDKAKAELNRQIADIKIISKKLNEIKVKKFEENKARIDSMKTQLIVYNQTLIKKIRRKELKNLKEIKQDALTFMQQIESIELDDEIIINENSFLKDLSKNKFTEQEMKTKANYLLKQKANIYRKAERIQQLKYESNFLICFITDMQMVFNNSIAAIQNLTTDIKMVFSNLFNNLKRDIESGSFKSEIDTFVGSVYFIILLLFFLYIC